MLMTTTPTLEGRPILRYHGLVTGEVVVGVNLFRDFFAAIRDLVGGRSASYEQELARARQDALDEMGRAAAALGANAVLGVDVDYESVGARGSMLMVSVTGTAVTV